MVTLSSLNYLAIVVTGIVYFIIGSFWYSKVLFADAWVKESGVTMGGSGKAMPVIPMAGQFITSILYAFGIAVIIQLLGKIGVAAGLKAAFLVIVAFVLPMNSSTWFFKNKPVLFLIEGGYLAVGAVALGIILSLWR